jgi:GTP-binding protein YchF
MGFKCGLVGLPNVGKSTIFNAVTNAGAQAANYPFCTIEPNVGMVEVPDPRLDELAKVHKPRQVIPAVMQFVDIAGLVEGASKGEGLGNQFLTHIRECDAILEVVRCFDDTDIIHVSGKVDPIHDVEIIETELILKDLDSVEKTFSRVQKLAKGSDLEAKLKASTLEKVLPFLERGELARTAKLSEEEIHSIKDLNLLTLKPMFYCANVSEGDIGSDNEYVKKLKAYALERGAEVVTICGKIEEELAEMDANERSEFLKELGLSESGLDSIIRKGYATLGLDTYFTAGEKEVRAWTFPHNAKAPQCAGVIHSDFERGFIRAETLAFSDFLKYGSWPKAKEAGVLRTEGKEYVVQDGDIMHFLFNV